MSDEGQQEPSMEDILASIRKILSEDEEEEGGEEGVAEAEPEQAAEPEAEPEPEPEPEPEEDDGPDLAAMLAESDEEDEAAFADLEPVAEPSALELTDEMMVEEQEEVYQEPEPAPVVEQPAPPPPQPAQEQPYQPYGQEGIVADQVEQVAGVHIAQLAQAVAQERALTMGNQGITIEQLVREICTPILKHWLDQLAIHG
jgi:cell pole-organizing protein PopZ